MANMLILRFHLCSPRKVARGRLTREGPRFDYRGCGTRGFRLHRGMPPQLRR